MNFRATNLTLHYFYWTQVHKDTDVINKKGTSLYMLTTLFIVLKYWLQILYYFCNIFCTRPEKCLKMPSAVMECGPKCRSRRHAYELNAAITKCNLPEVKKYAKLCYNGTQLCDMFHRSALHVAAGCGKTDIVEWLLEEMQGDCTQKDLESGWTALHRAVFYGQLAASRLLIQVCISCQFQKCP